MPQFYHEEDGSERRDEMIERLARIIAEARAVSFLTGAGISTDSGVPDFRSADGIYSTTSEEIFAIDSFLRDPARFYRVFAPFYRALSEARPNPGHLAIAELERRGGKRVAVVTQNIDGLHSAAGSENVAEIHGTLRTATCLECERRAGKDAYHDAMLAGESPRCPECGGVLKPDVVFFGEDLPGRELAAAERAMWEARALIVAGTSLQVYPAAGLPRECDAGAPFVVINKTPTPLDPMATLVFRASISDILPAAVARALGSE